MNAEGVIFRAARSIKKEFPLVSEQLVAQASNAVDRALAFIERNGIETFDPLDLSTHEISHRLLTVRTRSGTLLRKALWAGAYIAPQVIRTRLGIRRRPMHSGIANLAAAYIELGGGENIAKAKRWLEWLETNAIRGDEYLAWGFPFPWKQKLMVLPGTPIGHTTMTCANVFLKYFLKSEDPAALRVAEAACNTFHKALRHSPRGNNSVALSYTPLDETHILNIQADISSVLFRLHACNGDQRHLDLGLKLLLCVLETQNKDGSWGYYAPDTATGPNFVDSHHTGMVLSALAEISECSSLGEELAEQINQSIHRGAAYFLKELFTADGIPKYLDTSIYPIEIYNFAQSIITCLDLRKVVTDRALAEMLETRLAQMIEYLLRKMQLKSGGFLYRRTKFVNQNLGSLRWADALTTAALARWVKEARYEKVPRRTDVFATT